MLAVDLLQMDCIVLLLQHGFKFIWLNQTHEKVSIETLIEKLVTFENKHFKNNM
jgi:hypothetical protein